MGWIAFALWLVLTPIWITYWLAAASSSKIAFIPPALVLAALVLAWLWQQFVVLIAGEAEPAPRGKIQETAADWRAERDLVFRPKRSLHPVWGLALPSRGTIRMSLIAAAAGACIGAGAMMNRPSFEPSIFAGGTAWWPATRSAAPMSVRTEAVKAPSASAAPIIQSNPIQSNPVQSNPVQSNSPAASSNGNSPLQRAEVQPPSTNGQSSTDQAGCDVSLCERSYRSFRASDCTYQPYGGPRQYCTR